MQIICKSIFAHLIHLIKQKYGSQRNALNQNTSSQSNTTDNDTINGLKVLAYICWILCWVFIIIIFCIFKSIRLAIEIIKAAAEYVQDTPSAFLVPFLLLIFLSAFYVLWIIVALYLYSSGSAYSSGASPIANFVWNTNTRRLLVFWVFELLWNNAFIIAISQFVLASSVALWYFSQGLENGPRSTIRRSFYRAFRYHIGSLAFGSFLLAFIQLLQLILAFIEVLILIYINLQFNIATSH